MFPLQSAVDQFWAVGEWFLPYIGVAAIIIVVGLIVGLYLRFSG